MVEATKIQSKTANCEIHGDYQQKFIPDHFRTGAEIITGRCPGCVQQIKKEEQRRNEANAKYARQHHVKHCVTQFQKNTPKRFLNCTFENYTPDCKEANAAKKAITSYVEKFDSIGANGAGLILCGKLGTGKTHLAISAGVELAKKGKEVSYINLLDLIRWVRSSWNNDSFSEDQILSRLSKYDLLIIDEIGVQNGTENERTILFDIINSRYENMVPTFIISNLKLDEIKQLISERSVDRITDGGGGTIVFDWDSHRNKGTA
jgi:DNA replication protein DnaC